jgi:hypothetical protein
MAATKRAVPAARKATDKRTVGTAKNPKKVVAPSAAAYKTPKPVKVAKGKAGRPKKAQ